MRRTFKAFASCLFALVVIMTSCGHDNDSPEAIAASFTSAWANADFKKMMSLSDENYQQNILWLASILESDEKYDDYADKQKKQNWQFTQDGAPRYNGGSSVSIEYLASGTEFPDSSSRSIVGLARGEGGKWKVAYFQQPQ